MQNVFLYIFSSNILDLDIIKTLFKYIYTQKIDKYIYIRYLNHKSIHTFDRCMVSEIELLSRLCLSAINLFLTFISGNSPLYLVYDKQHV